MENAAEAIKMAGAVLLFVLALSIILLAYGQVRESADTILNYRDRETMYIDANYYYEQADNTERNVNLDTIIPSVFRAYIENYKIVFDGLEKPIYYIINKDGEKKPKYTLDLETNQNLEYKNAVLANTQRKINFIKAVFYGVSDNYTQDDMEKDLEELGVIIDSSCKPLYEQLTDKFNNGYKITEYLGVYYQNDNPEVPDVNKTQKRVITYKITPPQ